MNKPVIALMCKSHDYRTTSNSTKYTTSAWTMSNKKANSIIGQNVILTESKNMPAYMGGRITSVTQSTKDSTRFDIEFDIDPSLKGNTDAIGHTGWGNGRAVCYI